MKKIILLLLILCCMVQAMALNTSATEELNPEDSRYISPEVAEAICEEDTIITIKAYELMLPSDCCDCGSIDEVLSRAYEIKYIQEYTDGWYVVWNDSNGCYQKIKEGENGNRITQHAVQEFKTGEAIMAVSPDITVQEMYYLDSEDSYTGSAIFYRTNLGDYVFTNLYSVGTHLFTAEVFWEYMEAVDAYNRPHADRDGGPNFDICDLSAYDFRSPDFDPNQPLPEIEIPKPQPKASDYLWPLLIAVPLAAVLGIWVFRKRKPTDGIDDIPVDGQMDAKE